jgi:hypothetical protein
LPTTAVRGLLISCARPAARVPSDAIRRVSSCSRKTRSSLLSEDPLVSPPPFDVIREEISADAHQLELRLGPHHGGPDRVEPQPADEAPAGEEGHVDVGADAQGVAGAPLGVGLGREGIRIGDDDGLAFEELRHRPGEGLDRHAAEGVEVMSLDAPCRPLVRVGEAAPVLREQEHVGALRLGIHAELLERPGDGTLRLRLRRDQAVSDRGGELRRPQACTQRLARADLVCHVAPPELARAYYS